MASFPDRVSALSESPTLLVDHIAALTHLKFKFETAKTILEKKKEKLALLAENSSKTFWI